DTLPPDNVGELLSALLGADPAVEPLKRLLVRRGNPFFIEESIRTLVETEALTGERGAYCLTRPIQVIEVPATVQVILAARIDRLPADDKHLLQTASVIGKDVPLGVAPGDRRDRGGGRQGGAQPPASRRAPLRGPALSRGGVHVQAHADARGR